jgi:hypothetical protein
MELKFQYDIIMEELTAKGKVKIYTQEEIIKIQEALSIPGERIWGNNKKMAESERELNKILLIS